MKALAHRFQGAWRSDFLQAIATLSGGNVISAILPILAAPILGRLYGPYDYGVLAQYMGCSAILAVIAGLQFHHAVIAEQTDRGAGRAVWLCLLSAMFIAGLTALSVILLWGPVFSQLAAEIWFALLPLGALLSGISVSGNYLANRHRRYRWIAGLQVSSVVATVSLSMTLGILGWGAEGLLCAYLFGQLIQAGAYLHFFSSARRPLGQFPGLSRLRMLFLRHWRFPAFSLPNDFINQVNLLAPVFTFSALGSMVMLGAFTRSNQLVQMPLTLFANSVGEVFRREASESYRTTGSCRNIMRKTALGVLTLALPFSCVIMATAPWILTAYLGPQWTKAGDIARILAPMLVLRAVAMPVSTVFYFTGNQPTALVLSVMLTALLGLTIGTAFLSFGTDLSVLYAIVGSMSVFYVAQIAMAWRVAGP